MPQPTVPAHVQALAEERSQARAARDWVAADTLRARIEEAGWRVIDDGTAFTLRPAHPPDEVVDGLRIHGSPASVPSRLAEPDAARATIALLVPAGVAAPSPDDALRAIAGVGLADVQVLVVAGRGPAPGGPHDELIGTSASFSAAESLEAALRRSIGRVVVVLASGQLPLGDFVSPLESALADSGVAVAGGDGMLSEDLRRYRPAPPGDVTVVGPACYAFRRAEAAAPGLLDSRLNLPGSVAAWLSLALRDRGPDALPRRALAIDLPLGDVGPAAGLPEDHARQARRDAYRIAARFRRRRWLAAGPAPASARDVVERAPGERADGEQGHQDPEQGDDAGEAQPGRSPRGVRRAG